MGSTAIAAEVTNVIRGLGTGVARDIQVPANQVLGLIAFALRASSSVLDFDTPPTSDVVIVDRDLTRC